MLFHKFPILFLLFVPFIANAQEARCVFPQEKATYYHDKFVGRRTSSGEVFSQKKYTAAHKYLRFGTLVRVINPKNNKVVIVKINDRCPKDGIIDLSYRAAKQIEIIKAGKTSVNLEILPDSFYGLWMIQDSIFSMFSEYTSTDSLQESYQDAIELFKKSKDNVDFRGKYFLEIPLSENATDIISLFPAALKVYARIIHLNTKQGSIIVVPFNNEKEAEKAKIKLQSLFEEITIKKYDA